MNQLLLFVALLCVSFSGISGYTVQGNKLYDPTGAQVRLRGVDRPSFEWNALGEDASLSDYSLMRDKWAANVVRISLNQDFWLAGDSYAVTIDQQVAWVTSLGMGVILDLHWNNGGQQQMADKNSITFWSAVATRYKSNAWVMFELYNEPHDIAWSVWLNGDSTWSGMQNLYDAVRAAGAQNTVLVGGLNWAYDLSGVSSGYAVQGTNIAYATHPYDYAGKQLGDWPTGFGSLASTYPVVMTEFGQYCATDTYVSDLLNYAENLGIHWTVWAWYVSGCAFPSIISDWTGTPYPGVGETVQRYMAANSGQTSTSGSTSTTAPTTAPTAAPITPAAGALSVYTDSLQGAWQDWSWSTSYSLSDTQYVHSGSDAIRFELVSYQGIYFHTTSNFVVNTYNQLVFYVNGGTSPKDPSVACVKVYSSSGTVIGNSVNFPVAILANQWVQVAIPISSFGLSASTPISGFVIQSNVDTSAGNIWIDDISFVPAGTTSTTAPTTAPTQAATTRPTTAPTQPPATQAPTTTPTVAATQAPATQAPTTQPTTAPTQAPVTLAPTTAPTSSGCGVSSVNLVQTYGSSWQSSGNTVSQYSVAVSHTCAGKKLVSLTITATNWSPINYWNIVADGNTLTLPSYVSISTTDSPFSLGYQNTVGQATFTITSVTFQ